MIRTPVGNQWSAAAGAQPEPQDATKWSVGKPEDFGILTCAHNVPAQRGHPPILTPEYQPHEISEAAHVSCSRDVEHRRKIGADKHPYSTNPEQFENDPPGEAPYPSYTTAQCVDTSQCEPKGLGSMTCSVLACPSNSVLCSAVTVPAAVAESSWP